MSQVAPSGQLTYALSLPSGAPRNKRLCPLTVPFLGQHNGDGVAELTDRGVPRFPSFVRMN